MEIVKKIGSDKSSDFYEVKLAVGDQLACVNLSSGESAMLALADVEESSSADYAAAKKAEALEADRKVIQTVVSNTAELEKEFEGNIVIYHSCSGGITMEKAPTKAEMEIINASGNPLLKAFKLRKELFGPTRVDGKRVDTFPEYTALTGVRSKAMAKIKNFGIPFISDGATVVKIAAIPEIERLCDDLVGEMNDAIEKVIEAYPSRVEGAREALGDIYNAGDYPPVHVIQQRFRFTRKWMHFGVPEVLKEIDASLYEQERKRTAQAWAEIKKNGEVLMRKTLAELVDGLAESVTDKEDGTKKRFFTSTVTKLDDFFASFDGRNLMGDEALKAEVERLKNLVGGASIERFKTDDAFRAHIAAEAGAIHATLVNMTEDAEMRQIVLD